MDSSLLMDPSNQIIKPAADHKAALTSVTPSNVGHDTGVDRQLSDDAAAPNFPTSSDEEVKPANEGVAVPEVPQAPDTFDQMDSPFAAVAATALDEGDNNSDSIGDEGARAAAFAELMELGGSAAFDASRQHHLLRHSLPNEQRGTGVLSHFGVDTISDAAKIIKKMSQRELQAKFKLVYGARTFSNNNNWLRRKLFEAIGLDPSKGAVKKPGAGTQRRRRTAKPAAPRTAAPRLKCRTTARGQTNDINSQPIAEALIALGELASLAYDGYDLDDLQQAANAVDNSSDGRVPSPGHNHVDDGRLSSPEDGGQGEDGVRGVPGALPASPEADEPQQQEDLVDANDTAAAAAQMGHMFEWIAHMQRQAIETASPHHAAMMAAMMSNPAHAQQAQQVQALQLAAMAGHPHAQQMLHAIMLGMSGIGNGAMPVPAAAAAPMEMFHHMMQEAQQQHQQSMMQQTTQPQLVAPMFAGQK
jgi:hypothetical protein